MSTIININSFKYIEADMANYSRNTLQILHTFGQMIRLARLERKMPQMELAQRLGVSRQTVSALEQGDAKVGIGIVFEAAMIVGIPLLATDHNTLEKLSTVVGGLATLLPSRTMGVKEWSDDF